MSFKGAVCRGSITLGNHCGRCERCDMELAAIKELSAELSKSGEAHKPLLAYEIAQSMKKAQAAQAEKSDAHQYEMFDDGKAQAESYANGGYVGGEPVKVLDDFSSQYVFPLAAKLGPKVVGSLHPGLNVDNETGTITIVEQKHHSPIKGHSGLPVAGYAPVVEQWKIDMVNENKIAEEKALRRVDEHVRNRDSQEIDQASVQLARRHIEDAFYRLNRAIMQPKRIQGDLK